MTTPVPNEGQHRLAAAFTDGPPPRERSARRRRQLAEQLKPGPYLDGLRHLQARIDAGEIEAATPSQTIALGYLREAEAGADDLPPAA